jgi:hypothetical protein
MDSDLDGLRVVVNRECDVCGGSGQDGHVDCEPCHGEGRVADDVSLQDLADWILARVPRSLIPKPEMESLIDDLKRSITAAASKSRGLADPDEAGSWLRVVQEGAESLRAIAGLVGGRER